jgi:polysaccharide transporter, PST family
MKIAALFGATPLRKIRESRVTHNILALYGTQVAAYLFPLATIPYLARTLGPHNWGLVAYAQAMGLYLSMVVEFGFQLSATRRIARLRGDREQLAVIVAGVMGAKALLACACLAAVCLMPHFLQTFREHERIFWAGSLSGIGQGFSMLWFYQGLERMKTSAAMDIAGKAAATAGIFALVHRQTDAWKVPALQCVCYCGVSIALLAMAYRQVEFRLPTRRATWIAMRESAAMFLFRSAVSLYTTANTLILGAVATPVAVAFYSGAERLTRAPLGLLSPVGQSLYPRLSHLMTRDRARAAALARLSLACMAIGGLLLWAAVFLGAPLIVRLALGPGYERVVPVMRILSVLIPAVTVSNVLGIQWMLPLGMDRVFNYIIISAGLLNLALAGIMAPRWQETGMALAVTISESAITAAMCVVLIRRNLNPLSRCIPSPPGGSVPNRSSPAPVSVQ